MANLLCSSTCGTLSQPPVAYHSLCDANSFRRFAFPYFALIKCDFAFASDADVLDASVWEAAKVAGDIQIGVRGKIDFTASAETSSDIDVCGGDTVIKTVYDVNISSYQAVKFEDCRYYADILKNHKKYRMIWFDCDGCVYMPANYTEFVYDTNNGGTPVSPIATSPGFEFTVSSPPIPTEGDGQYINWSFTAQIELDGQDMICYTQIPGLFEALQA